jgi:hypothetical protein
MRRRLRITPMTIAPPTKKNRTVLNGSGIRKLSLGKGLKTRAIRMNRTTTHMTSILARKLPRDGRGAKINRGQNGNKKLTIVNNMLLDSKPVVISSPLDVA